MTDLLFPNGMESMLYCPTCVPRKKLVVRTNKQNQTQFLGCPGYPMCDHTQKIPDEWILRALGQPELFDLDKERGVK